MKKYEPPKCIITEITITNVSKYHEGRIDAILEYNGNQYGLVDWKTYDVNQIISSGIEK
jgi:ATP-dependent exoDNAse (exonuclease V) beta subunit